MKSESSWSRTLAAERSAAGLGIGHLYLELGKPRLSTLVVITTFAGFMLAGPEIFRPGLLFWTLMGTACAALGANSFNQWREAALDALMERTRRRPLPMGQLTPRHALVWAWSVSLAGVLILAWFVNGLTAFLGALNIGIYVLIYTPLKRVSSLCTLAGAVCGAIPPLMGWSATTGQVAPWVYQRISETFVLDRATGKPLSRSDMAPPAKPTRARCQVVSRSSTWPRSSAPASSPRTTGRCTDDSTWSTGPAALTWPPSSTTR